MPSPDPKLEIPQWPLEQLAYWTRYNRDPKPECFVYVLQARGDSPVKVGKANDVLNRIASLQTGNPRTIELVGLIVGSEELERAWHYELRKSRLVGEWFDGPEIPAFVEKVNEIAHAMLSAYQTTKLIPDWNDFVSLKERKRRRKPKAAPVKTSFVAPQPLSAEEVQRNLWRREKERFHRVKMPDDFDYPKP